MNRAEMEQTISILMAMLRLADGLDMDSLMKIAQQGAWDAYSRKDWAQWNRLQMLERLLDEARPLVNLADELESDPIEVRAEDRALLLAVLGPALQPSGQMDLIPSPPEGFAGPDVCTSCEPYRLHVCEGCRS